MTIRHSRPARAVARAAVLSWALASTAAFAQQTVPTDLPPAPAMPSVAPAQAVDSSSAASATAATPTVVDAAAASAASAAARSSAPGDPNAIRVLLSPEQETLLAAQIVGRIDLLDARLGQQVKEGQLLVRFDCQETAARLKMAQAEASAARETLGVKRNLQKLDAAGDTEVTLARADVQRTAAAIEVARAQLAQCEIKAPFAGRVVKLHAKQHQSVNAGAPLLELVSEGPLKLRLNVPSRMLRTLKMGSPIDVDIMETGQTYPAEITAINARVDAVAQTIELEAHLKDTPPELLPGMSGVARILQ